MALGWCHQLAVGFWFDRLMVCWAIRPMTEYTIAAGHMPDSLSGLYAICDCSPCGQKEEGGVGPGSI